MNFVISPEQTSQSGTNPMILPPSHSGWGGRGGGGVGDLPPRPQNVATGGGRAGSRVGAALYFPRVRPLYGGRGGGVSIAATGLPGLLL